MTDIPTITQEEAVEVRARELVIDACRYCGVPVPQGHLLIAPFVEESGPWQVALQATKTALSPNMDHAVGGVREKIANILEPGRNAFFKGEATLTKVDQILAVLTTPPVNQDAVREALEQIAANNWKDQSRARHVARSALATPPLDNTGLDAATVERCAEVARAYKIGFVDTADDAKHFIVAAIEALASGDRS